MRLHSLRVFYFIHFFFFNFLLFVSLASGRVHTHLSLDNFTEVPSEMGSTMWFFFLLLPSSAEFYYTFFFLSGWWIAIDGICFFFSFFNGIMKHILFLIISHIVRHFCFLCFFPFSSLFDHKTIVKGLQHNYRCEFEYKFFVKQIDFFFKEHSSVNTIHVKPKILAIDVESRIFHFQTKGISFLILGTTYFNRNPRSNRPVSIEEAYSYLMLMESWMIFFSKIHNSEKIDKNDPKNSVKKESNDIESTNEAKEKDRESDKAPDTFMSKPSAV